MPQRKSINHLFMIFCTISIGAVVSLCVLAFMKLLAFIHNIFFLHTISFYYNEKLHTPALLGVGIILVPVIGSLFVTWLIEKFASNERGLSVPEVIYSIHFKQGKIDPLCALAKVLASVISIGTGGSIGREGPIVQLSAAISAITSDLIKLSVHQKVILIAAGAAAGTAVIFNAPLGALAFAVEILLCNINFYSIAIIVIAEMAALTVSHAILGNYSVLSVINLQGLFSVIHLKQLLPLIPFGIFLGLVSIVFIRGLYFTGDLFSKKIKNSYVRHATGMLFVGIMLYLFKHFYGHYYIAGIGFATINDMLNLLISNLGLLAILLVCKLLATFLTLGSGASGGIFSPALFVGAAFGALWGIICQTFLPTSDLILISYVIAGMAGMLASVTGGIITAVLLCMEITKDTQHIFPLLITTSLAFITRKKFCEENVYILKLTRRNINMKNKRNY